VDDVAWAVLFLASEEGGYITGHTLNVSGGLYILISGGFNRLDSTRTFVLEPQVVRGRGPGPVKTRIDKEGTSDGSRR
jgi:hypothetical protein